MGVTDAQFYGNLTLYWNQYAFPAFDLAGLTDAINTSIVMPRIDAQMMIDAHPYLTRLNTFLSPAEMHQDAFFFESQDLPDISNVHTATIRTLCGNMQYTSCNAPMRLELADGSMIWLRAGKKGSTCQSGGPGVVSPLSSLPAAQMAWQRATAGEGMPVVDNTAKIQAGIDANNKNFPAEMSQFPPPVTGVAGSGFGGGSGGAGGAGGSAPQATGGGGCGCNLGDGVEGGLPILPILPILALLGALGLTRRRRRACRGD